MSSEELSAVTKLQREIRKYLTNKIMKCLETGKCSTVILYNATYRTTDSREHIGMMEQVSKSAELIAAHSEQLGKLVFRHVNQPPYHTVCHVRLSIVLYSNWTKSYSNTSLIMRMKRRTEPTIRTTPALIMIYH